MTSYTGVLLADTAVPAWHDAHRELPVLFAASALAAAGGLGLSGSGLTGTAVRDNAPAARLGAFGASVELAVGAVMKRRLGMIGERYRTGQAGRWMRAARILSAAGIAGALVSRRNRAVSVVSGSALLAGSLATRFVVFEAGKASAADPRDVIIPQRARLATRTAPSPRHGDISGNSSGQQPRYGSMSGASRWVRVRSSAARRGPEPPGEDSYDKLRTHRAVSRRDPNVST